jgi:predicted  nucleic acid-binding Zn-ribbon protein
MLENQDAMHKQAVALTQKNAELTLHELKLSLGMLDEAVKRHQALLEQTSSKLKQLSNQQHSASSSREIQQIADDLSHSREDLDAKRHDAARIAEISISNLTGSAGAPPSAVRPGLLTLMVLAIIAVGIFGAGIWLYIRHRLP